jgi:hypothetical protein
LHITLRKRDKDKRQIAEREETEKIEKR